VVGPPRAVPSPGGGSEWKFPISGLDAGFGHTLNDHAWQMDDPYRFLYIGTYNASIAFKDDPVYGQLLRHNMGAHLYRTREGWYYSPVTTTGFANLGDPNGGRFDYGIRTMVSTPHGAFLGTANDHYGLRILRANTRGSTAPDPLERVEIEQTRAGGALLSWPAASATGALYQIWRAKIHAVFIRDNLNFEAWSGETGNKLRDTYIGPYEQIGVTANTAFIDTTVQPAQRYMYYIVLKSSVGRTSDPSTLVTFPLLTPAVTFSGLLQEVNRMEQRQRYRDPVKRLSAVRMMITDAQRLAARCDISGALRTLNATKAAGDVLAPEATDLEVLMSKLIRRLTLFSRLPQDVSSAEFCTQT
jgi:hypothetical protein